MKLYELKKEAAENEIFSIEYEKSGTYYWVTCFYIKNGQHKKTETVFNKYTFSRKNCLNYFKTQLAS